ncbi:MAG TPA: MaoC/PaaZ C-terminal domain-containing protein [Desulfosalsimonadaceae bacterium]|nr:MaoC/PaaZ C-terminal domain-containing protein [Desulfosalsimonadaceae bacterium]
MSDEYQIDARALEGSLPEFEAEVSQRDTMNFAAAVGDENPWYLDDSRAGGIIAPPMYAAAFTWPVMERFQQRLQEHLPPEVLGSVVHAGEYLAFSRPVRPGDRLQANSAILSVEPAAAGTRAALRIEVEDEQKKPVFVEEAGFLFRGVPCSSSGAGGSRQTSWPQPKAGGKLLWEQRIPVSRSAPWVYDGCTNIVFPIHTSVDCARRTGLPDVILQGTATLALAAREIVTREAGMEPARVRELACRFTGMVVPATSIRVQVVQRRSLASSKEVYFQVLNAREEPALSDGYASIAQ